METFTSLPVRPVVTDATTEDRRFSNVDLHCHSTASDGTLSPSALAARAKANGVSLWSLTDHDTLAGQEEAAQAAHTLGLDYVTGVEISVSVLNKTVHLIALDFDAKNLALQQGLLQTRSGRLERAQAMAQALKKIGLPDTLDGALRYANDPELISRSHFGRYLVEIGVCKDTAEVFRKYLGDGRPGYIPYQWAKLEDAMDWVKQADGVVVIAHPARYQLNPLEESHLFEMFRDLGGVGMEVVTGSHSTEEARRYAKVVEKEGFFASRGSDFHTPSTFGPDLGRLPPLPSQLLPIWQHLPSLQRRPAH